MGLKRIQKLAIEGTRYSSVVSQSVGPSVNRLLIPLVLIQDDIDSIL